MNWLKNIGNGKPVLGSSPSRVTKRSPEHRSGLFRFQYST